MNSLSDDFIREMYSPYQTPELYMHPEWHTPRVASTDSDLIAGSAALHTPRSAPVICYTNSHNYKPSSNVAARKYPQFRALLGRGQSHDGAPGFYSHQSQSYNDLLSAYPPSPASPLSVMHSVYQSESFPMMALQGASSHIAAVTPTTPESFKMQGEDILRSRGIRPFEMEFPNFQGDGRNKPPYPYVELIAYAINSHPSQKMALSEIYSWLLAHFPWFRTATSNWRNSVRHNLSLNKKFVRVPREAADGVGKGDLWTVEPAAELAGVPTRNRRKSSAAKIPYERKKSSAAKIPYERKKSHATVDVRDRSGALKPTRKLLQAAPPKEDRIISPATDVSEAPASAALSEDFLYAIFSQPPTPHIGHPLSWPLPERMQGSSESLESLLEALV